MINIKVKGWQVGFTDGSARFCTITDPVLFTNEAKRPQHTTANCNANGYAWSRCLLPVSTSVGSIRTKTAILRGLLRDIAPELKKWIWTKAGFLGGELVFSHPAFDDKQNTLLQKPRTDLMWAIGLENILDAMKNFDSDASYWQKYADASNTDAKFQPRRPS